ncbi:hypothetical protein DPMN_034610 [Dreissena polymorpha]|uniref:Uncharacterized protein n=1 Tax=Dreissena polymorpha TaxID=45954 RepID=A0A9D4RM87_DREPO|nr:hypothetical protein DPMN_034610 [Dreissena polymorpha]
MKLAVVFLCLLPFVFSASINERFIESLLGGIDIFSLAQQIVTQFGTSESEQQCEKELCPPLVHALDFHISLITDLVCGAVCKEVQVLAQHAG